MQRTRFNRRLIITIILSVVFVGVLIATDLLTKTYFKNLYDNNGRTTVIENFFYFSFTLNSGSAFSFLADKSWGQTFFKVLTCFAMVAFIAFFVYALKNNHKFLGVGILFVIGGTLGNFIDRLAFDCVRDFISFVFGSYYFPIFNLADTYLTIGTVMLIVHYLFIDKNAIFKKNEDNKV